jgi:hypothetical protein
MRLFFALLLPVLVSAAILPDDFGPYHRASTSQPVLQDRPLWDEYGLKSVETGVYEGNGKSFTVTAYDLPDTTASLAAFDWLRSPKATPSKLAKLASETEDSLLLTHGNYLLSFKGYKPDQQEFAALADQLRNVDSTVLPLLPGYLPSDDLALNSERYVTGPVALARFDSGISPSVAGFHLGVEAQTGVFHSPKGDMTLAIFDYPTNQMAIQKIAEFEKIPGAMAKRNGPLIAVILSPADPDAAERLLSKVRYSATITQDQYVLGRRDNIGTLVINAFILIGILGAFCILSGLFVGGVRVWLRRGRGGEEADAMIVLHLDKP